MGRLDQLKETLPANLRALQEANVEFVLVDYNSKDGLEDWIKSSRVLDDPRVVYVRERNAQTFHMCKAKNLAHLAAGGEVLVNLDADNFIDRKLLTEIESFFSDLSGGVLHCCNAGWGQGTCGRIAIDRALFLQLGGYDESFWPMGHQDLDLIQRAKAWGARFKLVEKQIGAIGNSKERSVALTGCDVSYHEMNMRNRQLMLAKLAAKQLVASRQQVPVSVNFGPSQMM